MVQQSSPGGVRPERSPTRVSAPSRVAARAALAGIRRGLLHAKATLRRAACAVRSVRCLARAARPGLFSGACATSRGRPGSRFALTGGGAVLLLLCALPAVVIGQAGESSKQEVVAAIPRSFPPEYSLDKNGLPQGFAIDVMNRIATIADLKITYRVYEDWAAINDAVRTGEADLIPITGITPERTRWLLFSRPVETFGISLFVRQSTSDVQALPDLDGKAVGAVASNAAIGELKKRPAIQVHVYPTVDEGLLALLSGEIDGLAYPAPMLHSVLRKSGLEDRIQTVGPPLLEVRRAIGVGQANASLVQRLEPAIAAFTGSPESIAIYAKWYGNPSPYWTAHRVALVMGSATAIIAVFGCGWWFISVRRLNVRLRQQVVERDRANAQRERMHEELLASESKYRSIVESPLQAIVIHRDGKPVFANEAFASLFGYPNAGDVLAEGAYSERIHPDDRQALSDYRAAVERGESPPMITVRATRPDGSMIWLLDHAVIVSFDGQPALQATMIDISERRRAIEELERYFQISNDGLVISDLQGNILRHNPSFAELLGYQPTELVGRNLFAFVDPADLEETQALAAGVEQQTGVDTIVNFENRYLHRDGSRVWLSWNVVLDEHDVAYSSARDITQQKLFEQQLVAERNRVQTLVEQAVDGILVIDGDARIQFANPAAGALFGRQVGELIGVPFGHPASVGPVEIAVPRGNGFRTVEMRTAAITWDAQAANLVNLRDVTEQRGVEQERLRLVAAVEQSGDAIILTDVQGWITYVNPAFERATGYTRAEAIGRKPNITKSGMQDRSVYAELWQTILAGNEWSGRLTNRRKDGELVIDEVRISPVFEESGEIINFVGVRHDVTERERSLLHVQERERQLSSIYDTVADVIFQLAVESDGRYRFTSINPAFATVTGLSFDQVVGRYVDQIIPEPALTLVLGKYREAIESKRIVSWEETSTYPTGTKTGVVSIAPNFDAAGHCTYLVGAVHDITARRRAEDAMTEREERFRAIFDTSVDIITLIDEQASIRLQSPSVRAVLGFDPEEMVGHNAMEFIHPDDAAAVQSAIAQGFADRTVAPAMELRMRRKDGSWCTLEARGRALPHDSLVGGAVITSRDISEQQKLERQLLESQKLETVGRLAGGIAHDFNNMLAVILSYSEFVKEAIPVDNSMRDDIQQVIEAANRSASLTRQLLAFSRRQVLKLEPVNMNDVVRGLEKMLRRLIGEDVQLHIGLAPDLGIVTADISQLEQVLLNLAVNARDAMPYGGMLTVETANVELDEDYAQSRAEVTPGYYVQLVVSDTGVGMDEATRQQVFEPFFTTKEQGKGTGLGLSTVFGIVKQLNGHVNVYSEPGQGATFRIYLPRVMDPQERARALANARTTPTGTGTILLVEDEPQVRIATRRILESSGYTVIEAEDAPMALTQAEAHGSDIDLLLTDVVMPGMSGAELAKRLLALRPRLQILYMTGYTEGAVSQHGLLDQGVRLLSKPFTKELLLEQVREALDPSSTKPNRP